MQMKKLLPKKKRNVKKVVFNTLDQLSNSEWVYEFDQNVLYVNEQAFARKLSKSFRSKGLNVVRETVTINNENEWAIWALLENFNDRIIINGYS